MSYDYTHEQLSTDEGAAKELLKGMAVGIMFSVLGYPDDVTAELTWPKVGTAIGAPAPLADGTWATMILAHYPSKEVALAAAEAHRLVLEQVKEEA